MTDTSALYARLAAYLDESDFDAGERIGSERALADQFAVTRSELRAVLDVLERDGRIRRTIGRAGGVFRWDGKIERHLNAIEGVPDILRQQGFRSDTEVLHAGIAIATPIEMRALRLGPGDAVFRLRRRRDANGVPLSLDSMTLSLRMVPGFAAAGHSQSVYRVLAEQYGIEAVDASETIDVVGADDEQARILGIEAGAPLLEIHRVTYSQDGIPFEYAHDFFRADRTRITLRKHGARWKRAAGGRSA